MGEYALYKQRQIKIGTCESMYYLRDDQRTHVTATDGNVDPVKDRGEIRFRFPWPDEDQIEPGHFEDYSRALAIYGFAAPADVEHGSVQFSAQPGYLISLPCPEGAAWTTRRVNPALDSSARLVTADGGQVSIHVARNGFRGAVLLQFTKYRPGIGLVPVLECGGCGAMWREEDRSRIEELSVCLRSEGDRRTKTDGPDTFYHAIADRILAGLESCR